MMKFTCRQKPGLMPVVIVPCFMGLALLLASCSVTQPVQDQVTRHLLQPVFAEVQQNRRQPRVAVARPVLPGYLDAMSMVTRSASGQIRSHRQDLWAEPLDVNMSRVLASNLRRLTRSPHVQTVESFVTADYDRLLEIRVHQFDPDPIGRLVLECDWRLQPLEGGDVATRQFRTEVPMAGGSAASMSAQVIAMNEALGRLAASIAADLR